MVEFPQADLKVTESVYFLYSPVVDDVPPQVDHRFIYELSVVH